MEDWPRPKRMPPDYLLHMLLRISEEKKVGALFGRQAQAKKYKHWTHGREAETKFR